MNSRHVTSVIVRRRSTLSTNFLRQRNQIFTISRNSLVNCCSWNTKCKLYNNATQRCSFSQGKHLKISSDVVETKVETISAVVEDLQNRTNLIISKYNELQSPSLTDQSLAKELVSTIEDWFNVTNSIIVPKERERRTSRLVHQYDDNGDSLAERGNGMNELKILSAESMSKLLTYHIRFNISSNNVDFMDKNVTRPFYLVMKSWDQIGAMDSSSGTKAAAVLDSWGEVYGGDITYAPSIKDFNVVLSAYANNASGDYNMNGETSGLPAENAWDIYSLLSQLSDITLRPNIVSYVHTIRALTHHAFVMTYSAKELKSKMNAEVAAIRAFSVWKIMLKKLEVENYDDTVVWGAHNDILTLSSHGLLRRDEIESQDNQVLTVGRNTETLLNQILEKYNGDLSTIPKELLKRGTLSIMRAWTSEQSGWIKRAQNNQQYNEDLVTSVTRAALSVEGMLVRMNELDINPSYQHYLSVIRAYHNCLDRNVVKLDDLGSIEETLLPHLSCYEFLNEMESRCLCKDIEEEEEDKNENQAPKEKLPAKMYELVLASFSLHAQLGKMSPSDIEKVDAVFRKMMIVSDRNLLWMKKEHTSLTTALNHALNVYSKFDSDRYIFQRSIDLVHLLANNLNTKQTPNIDTYSILLSILAKSNLSNSGSIALEIFEEMKANDVQPNTVIYTKMMKILSASKDASLDFCKELLRCSFEEYDSLSENDKQTSDFDASTLCASLITAKIRRGANEPKEAIDLLRNLNRIYESSQDQNYKPSIVLYGSVLNSLSRSNAKSSLTTSLELLDEIESSFRRGESELMPTKQCYTSILKTVSNSGLNDAVDKAEELLERMENLYDRYKDESLKPDHMIYSSLLQTYSRSQYSRRRSSINVKRAEEIMGIIETKATKSEFPWPNASAYTALINIYKKNKIVDMGEKSEAIIKKIDQASEIHGNNAPKANAFVFGAAISAWASSNSPQKPIKAWELLERMCDRYDNGDLSCKPTVIVLKQVLNACAYNKNKETQRDSVKIAIMTTKKFLDNAAVFGKCDSAFFNSILKVYGYCIPDSKERLKFTTATFETCAKEGYVDELVLASVKKFSPQIFYELPGMSDNGGNITLDSLPKDWCRNAR